MLKLQTIRRKGILRCLYPKKEKVEFLCTSNSLISVICDEHLRNLSVLLRLRAGEQSNVRFMSSDRAKNEAMSTMNNLILPNGLPAITIPVKITRGFHGRNRNWKLLFLYIFLNLAWNRAYYSIRKPEFLRLQCKYSLRFHSIIEILRVINRIVFESLRKTDSIRANQFTEFRPNLIEKMLETTSAIRSKSFSFFIVHLQISSEGSFARQNPGPSPIPPLPERTTGEIAHWRHGFGSAERPGSTRRRNRLDLEGNGREPSA